MQKTTTTKLFVCAFWNKKMWCPCIFYHKCRTSFNTAAILSVAIPPINFSTNGLSPYTVSDVVH